MSPDSGLGDWFRAFVTEPGFLRKYPLYAAVLAKVLPVSDPSVGRMAVSFYGGQFFLHVNVDAFVAEPQYVRGVLLHEVHHIVLGHLTHPKFADVNEPEMMDLAVEISANEYIEEPLPPAITWRNYSAIGIRAGQSTTERYEWLVRAARAGGTRVKASNGEGTSHVGNVDDHRYLRKADGTGGAVTRTEQLISAALAEAPMAKEADGGKRIGPLLAGQEPGRLIEELMGTTLLPNHFVDWKTALRMFVARSRGTVHTYGRPNRRFPARVGQIPGRTYAPSGTVKPRVLVVIDTSLSMTGPELEEVARQLHVASDYATLTVVECDVEVTRVYAWDGQLSRVLGRGGTDLRAIFTRDFLGAHPSDGVVYFTDGDGPFPIEAPPVPVLWVLTKPQSFACPWGERAWLTRRPGAR